MITIRETLVVSLVGMVLTGCVSGRGPAAPTKAKADLVFLGTVESIEVSSLPQSQSNWIVTFRIERVESGEFGEKTFSFRIHSPSKSGLETGKQYSVEATKTDTGYFVDQYQWLNGTHAQPAARTR